MSYKITWNSSIDFTTGNHVKQAVALSRDIVWLNVFGETKNLPNKSYPDWTNIIEVCRWDQFGSGVLLGGPITINNVKTWTEPVIDAASPSDGVVRIRTTQNGGVFSMGNFWFKLNVLIRLVSGHHAY